MPARDLALLTEAAREAGRIAMRDWRRDVKHWDKGGEHGPVTEADLAVNDMLKAKLLAELEDKIKIIRPEDIDLDALLAVFRDTGLPALKAEYGDAAGKWLDAIDAAR